MTNFLKQSTTTDVMFGVFVDDTDGKTTEEALTLTANDLQLSKNCGAALAKNESTNATHIYGGNYKVPLDATDTGALGTLELMCKISGALPIRKTFVVVPANIYDSIISGTGVLHADITQCGGSAVATGAIPNAAADAAGGLPISDAGGLDLDAKLANTNEITVARMGVLTDWINDGRLDLILDIIAADTTTDIPTLIAALENLSSAQANAACDTALSDYGANTTVPDAAGVAPTAAEIKTAIEAGGSSIAQILADTGTTLPAELLAYIQLLARSDAAIATDNATELTAINADGGSGAGDFANQTEALEVIRDRGDAAWVTGGGGAAPTVGEIRNEMEGTGTKLTLALEDTTELQENQANWTTATGFATSGALSTHDGKLDTLDTVVDRIVGLNQENFFIDDTTYIGVHMTGARVRIYSVAGSVGSINNVIATYTVTATYTGDYMTDYKVVKS